jgi:hypothetical protein
MWQILALVGRLTEQSTWAQAQILAYAVGLGCNVTYKYDEDLNDKLSKFKKMCEVIARTLKKKIMKETNVKFYKIMAVPVLLNGSETWTPRKRDWNRIQAAEMKYLRTVKGCTRLDQIRNEDVRNELGISPLSEKNNTIQE